MDSKKKRADNFNVDEKLKLVAKIKVKKSIIENKKTDALTSKQKEECWQKIANEWNSECSGKYRGVNSLKSCWKNLKKRTRKHYAAIQPSVDGLVNPFDSDATEGKEEPATVQKVEDEIDYESDDGFMLIESLEETPESNWSSWNPKMLRQKKSKELESSEQLLFADVDAALSHQASTSQPGTSALQPSSSSSTHHPSTLQNPLATSNLKRKRAPAARTATRVNATRTCNKHFAALAQSKFELVEMMKANMSAKSEIKMLILQTQLEKEQLEVKLLKHQLKQRKRHCLESENQKF